MCLTDVLDDVWCVWLFYHSNIFFNKITRLVKMRNSSKKVTRLSPSIIILYLTDLRLQDGLVRNSKFPTFEKSGDVVDGKRFFDGVY